MAKPISEVMIEGAGREKWSTKPEPPPGQELDPHRHPLRRHGVQDFADAITPGLIELIGPEYQVRVTHREFGPKSELGIQGMDQAVELTVRIIPAGDPEAEPDPDNPENLPF